MDFSFFELEKVPQESKHPLHHYTFLQVNRKKGCMAIWFINYVEKFTASLCNFPSDPKI